jgi:ribosomal protein L37AE/L43A
MSDESKECPECKVLAPKKQVENIGVCENCYLEGVRATNNGDTLNPEINLIDKWKTETVGVDV